MGQTRKDNFHILTANDLSNVTADDLVLFAPGHRFSESKEIQKVTIYF